MKHFYLGLGLLLLTVMGFAEDLAADLDSLSIELGKTVRLTLTYDPQKEQGVPDLNDLRNDFSVLATEQSMSYTVTNGRARSVGQWSIVLEPKHIGILMIPSLKIGHLSSKPLQLSVTPPTISTNKPPDSYDVPHLDAVELNAEADNEQPYLHQEVLYTVRLLTKERLLDMRYRAPQVADALVFPLGDGRQYQTTKEGVLYHVEEQQYAIFPQKSGLLPITPPGLRALKYDLSPKPITLEAKGQTLKVQKLPKHASIKTWLPSKLVRLRETYDLESPTLTQGATVVRTIQLQTQGLVAQLLPEINFESSEGLSVYPGQAEKDNAVVQGELWGRTTIKVTYVFARHGDIQIPAVQMPWFNVKTKQFEIAALPAKTYHILPKENEKKSVIPPAKTQVIPVFKSNIKPIYTFSKTGMGLLFGLGVFVFLFGFYKRHHRARQPYKALKAACFSHDPQRAQMALLGWGKQQWPNKELLHLNHLIDMVQDKELIRTVQALMIVLYQTTPPYHWNGEELWQAIAHYKKPHCRATKKYFKPLPPIHPSREIHLE